MSIIAKANALKLASTTLIFGKSGHGRSHYAIETALNQGSVKVLFITLGAPSADIPETWDVAQILKWEDFTAVYMEAMKAAYDAIIFDKYNAALELIPTKDDTPSQQEWGHMAAKWSAQLNRFMGITKSLIVTVAVIEHPTDGRKIDLTPRALNNLVDKFSQKHYVFLANDKAGVTNFYVQPIWAGKGEIFDTSNPKKLGSLTVA